MFGMVDYVSEMTMKKSSNYGKYGMFLAFDLLAF